MLIELGIMTKTFLTKNLGCRLNAAEISEIERGLIDRGLRSAKSDQKPDVIVFNSCSVTAMADKKSRQIIRSLRRNNSKSFLVVTGCWVGYRTVRQKVRQLENRVDLLVPNQKKKKIVELIISSLGIKSDKRVRSGKKIINDRYQRSGRRFIKIQDGCNNYCSYCLVPLRRGLSVSRPVKKVVDEVIRAEAEAVREVVLTGVDIGDYQELSELIKTILSQTELIRIRLGSINYQAFNDQLIDLWQNQPRNKQGFRRLCQHFHISLQSGCNRTLKRMRRGYTIEEFELLVGKIRKRIEGVNITSDIIVGFPGETETEWMETYRFLKRLALGKIHVFRYSSRPGTLASQEVDKNKKGWKEVTAENKKKRAGLVQELSDEGEKKYANQFKGENLEVLIERIFKGIGEGWSDNYIKIKKPLENEDLVRHLIRVKC